MNPRELAIWIATLAGFVVFSQPVHAATGFSQGPNFATGSYGSGSFYNVLKYSGGDFAPTTLPTFTLALWNPYNSAGTCTATLRMFDDTGTTVYFDSNGVTLPYQAAPTGATQTFTFPNAFATVDRIQIRGTGTCSGGLPVLGRFNGTLGTAPYFYMPSGGQPSGFPTLTVAFPVTAGQRHTKTPSANAPPDRPANRQQTARAPCPAMPESQMMERGSDNPIRRRQHRFGR